MWADSEGSPNRASAPSTVPSSQASELDALFAFLGRIQQDQALRDQRNEVITATDMVTIAADLSWAETGAGSQRQLVGILGWAC